MLRSPRRGGCGSRLQLYHSSTTTKNLTRLLFRGSLGVNIARTPSSPRTLSLRWAAHGSRSRVTGQRRSSRLPRRIDGYRDDLVRHPGLMPKLLVLITAASSSAGLAAI